VERISISGSSSNKTVRCQPIRLRTTFQFEFQNGRKARENRGLSFLFWSMATIAPRYLENAAGSHFETCRRKRNIIDYDSAHVNTEPQAAELGGLSLPSRTKE
jgi:hypothetical protein